MLFHVVNCRVLVVFVGIADVCCLLTIVHVSCGLLVFVCMMYSVLFVGWFLLLCRWYVLLKQVLLRLQAHAFFVVRNYCGARDILTKHAL